jgi:hypothetical protein
VKLLLPARERAFDGSGGSRRTALLTLRRDKRVPLPIQCGEEGSRRRAIHRAVEGATVGQWNGQAHETGRPVAGMAATLLSASCLAPDVPRFHELPTGA